MDKKIIKLDNTGIEEYKLHQYKRPNKFPFGKQDFRYAYSFQKILHTK